MTINVNKTRLAVIIGVLVVIVAAVVFFAFGSGGSGNGGAPVAKPLKAVAAPPVVAKVQSAVNAQPIVSIDESGQVPMKYVIDYSKQSSAQFEQGKLSFLQIGGNAYAPTSTGCYAHGTRSSTLPDAAQLVLPSGVQGFTYTESTGKITWHTPKGSTGFGPHGVVQYDPTTNLMTGGTYYDAPNQAVQFTVTYPTSVPAADDSAPANLC